MNFFTLIALTFFIGLLPCCYGEFDTKECTEDPKMVNGCSIPWGIEFPYKDFFKPACNRHDICYSCGARYEWERKSCDNGFKKNMIYLCHMKEQAKESQSKLFFWSWQDWKDIANEVKGSWLVGSGMAEWMRLKTGSLEHCLNGVDIYYNAIRNFARKNFELIPEKHCEYKCAKIMGNPKIGLETEKDL